MKVKQITLKFYSTEYAISKVKGLYEIKEYREVKAFRGYRNVSIKSVLVENLDQFFCTMQGQNWRAKAQKYLNQN